MATTGPGSWEYISLNKKLHPVAESHYSSGERRFVRINYKEICCQCFSEVEIRINFLLTLKKLLPSIALTRPFEVEEICFVGTGFVQFDIVQAHWHNTYSWEEEVFIKDLQDGNFDSLNLPAPCLLMFSRMRKAFVEFIQNGGTSLMELPHIAPMMLRAISRNQSATQKQKEKPKKPEARPVRFMLLKGKADRSDQEVVIEQFRPVRIQLRRTKGWKMPPNTVKVARPTLWGNPFKIGKDMDAERAVQQFRIAFTAAMTDLNLNNGAVVIRHYQLAFNRCLVMAEKIKSLRGKNLACFCHPDQACHADVLLEFANA